MQQAAAALLVALTLCVPLCAQESQVPVPAPAGEDEQPPSDSLSVVDGAGPLASSGAWAGSADSWQTAWGLVGLRAIPQGVKIAPNGVEYHPNFSLDGNFNCWIWRDQGLYLFGDGRFWGQRSEQGVTNGRDGFFGTSKRQLDLSGGVAWNYAGPWEARVSGYSLSNLNRGTNLVGPTGFNDGCLLENRYYLSEEYSRLGQSGFDVTRATFLSVGYLPTKNLVGNDGLNFKPGLLLRAYLTQDLWDWPAYLFGDATFIGERGVQPKLLLFDLGLAVRPFEINRQWEFRLGAENTADFQVGNVYNIWYLSIRYIF